MKLFLGNHLIETDYIESVERLAAHSVKIYFVSGYELTVTCGVKSIGSAQWPEDADKFMAVIARAGTVLPKDKEKLQT